MKTGIKADLTLPSSLEIAITVILKNVFKSIGDRAFKVSVQEKEGVFWFFTKEYRKIQRNLKIL